MFNVTDPHIVVSAEMSAINWKTAQVSFIEWEWSSMREKVAREASTECVIGWAEALKRALQSRLIGLRPESDEEQSDDGAEGAEQDEDSEWNWSYRTTGTLVDVLVIRVGNETY